MCYIMKCEWLKNESNHFVTCKYFQLIVELLQTVTNVMYVKCHIYFNISLHQLQIYRHAYIHTYIYIYMYIYMCIYIYMHIDIWKTH